jgi:hypothetical protein
MGHITATAGTVEEALSLATKARQLAMRQAAG